MKIEEIDAKIRLIKQVKKMLIDGIEDVREGRC